MLKASLWLLGAVVAGGLGLSAFYLLERPIRGAARLASWVHGAAGAAGVLLLLAALPTSPADPNGFGWIAAGGLGLALLAGLTILAIRRRRPPGLIVALHATLAIGGYVILLAFAATTPTATP